MRGRWPRPMVVGMTTDTLQLDPVANSRPWARVFAAIYDPSLWIGERAGMRRHRQDLLIRARGRTLEIGSGTGLNLAHYPDDLDDLVLAEPDPSMRKRLESAVRRSEHKARVIDARAEQLPFADTSIDTVVSTLVLCTVTLPIWRCARSRGCFAPTGSSCSSSMCDPTHRRWHAGKTASPGHGSGSPRGAAATAPPSS